MRLGYCALVSVVVLLCACGGGGGGGGGFLPPGTQQFADEGQQHLQQDSPTVYRTAPPTSGNHYPSPTQPGFYDTEQKAGNLVHSLEHGNIVIYYDPALVTGADLAALQALATQFQGPTDGVVVTPRTDAQFPVIATAWTYMMRLRSYDAARINAFMAAFRGRGPEFPQAIRAGAANSYISQTTGKWLADTGFFGGVAAYFPGHGIGNTSDPELYRSERYGRGGNFSYTILTGNGNYTLELHFAEISGTAAGQRVFNVTANGNQILTNFDIFVEAGGRNKALVKTVPITVTNFTVIILFENVVGDAKISAIRIIATP